VPPTATATSTPFQFTVSSHSSRNNCADTGLEGIVNGSNGLPVAGVQIQYGEIGVAGSRFIATSDNNGRYGALLIPGVDKASYRSHNWYAYVVDGGKRNSDEFRFTTDPIFADNPGYCYRNDNNNNNNGNSNGNSNSSDNLPAGCILDPCKNSNTIQIKIINWQQRTEIPEQPN
jgi:hypothetical protein